MYYNVTLLLRYFLDLTNLETKVILNMSLLGTASTLAALELIVLVYLLKPPSVIFDLT
jgi:hypothetical protein